MPGRFWKTAILVALGMVALAVSGLAVAIRTAPPAAATTGSLVTIADPNNAGNLAHVSSAGALSTSVSGDVGIYPSYLSHPALNVSVATGAFNSMDQATAELLVPTQARIALTSITLAYEGNVGALDIDIVDVSVPNGTAPGSCLSAATSTSVWETFTLPQAPGANVVLAPSLPMAFFPPSGQTQCLAVEATLAQGSPGGSVHASATGYVVSGTYTP